MLKENHELKELHCDLETAPMLGAIFSRKQKYIPPQAILEHKSIISASYAWEDDGKVRSISLLGDKKRLAKSPYDDYHVVEKLYPIISEADFVIGHNFKNFDMKFFRMRCLVNGFPPFPEPVVIDTLHETQKLFNFEWKSLDYVTKRLQLSEKMKTSQDLWNRIVYPKSRADQARAIRTMCEYNDQDVEITREYYKLIRPWLTVGKRWNYIANVHSPCPKCHAESGCFSETDVTIEVCKSYWYKRYRCKNCKGWSRTQKNMGSRVC